jgi:hypothetical protein
MIMNDELEKMEKEVIVVYFKVVSHHVPRGTEKNHKNSWWR